ncbi:hypothetical protein ACHAXT_005052 [Thalassiosira profunda]
MHTAAMQRRITVAGLHSFERRVLLTPRRMHRGQASLTVQIIEVQQMESEGREDGVVAGGGAVRVGGVAKRRWLSGPNILARLNDPEVTELTVRFLTDNVNFGEFDGGAVDWWTKENFDAISSNTHLEDLEISGNVRLVTNGLEHQNITSFYRAVAANRSLESICIEECVIDPGEALSILGPFFENNTNLRGFRINVDGESGESPSPECVQFLLSALSRCNKSSLRWVSIDFDRIDDHSASTLVDTLATYDNLHELTLKFWSTSPNMLWASLGNLLSRKLLHRLELPFCKWIDEHGASSLAKGFAEHRELQELDLGGSRLSPGGWETLLHGLSNSSLEVLNLRESKIGDEALVSLGNVLATLPRLRYLELDYLGLDHEDEENSILISSQSWRDFFAAIESSCEGLEEIHLVANTIDDSVVHSLVNGLANKNRLRRMNLMHMGHLTAWGWSEIASLVCNKASAESILDSNHTIVAISNERVFEKLEALLRMNVNENKVEVARQKILRYHFSDGERNMDELLGMDTSVLPLAMAWMGRDHHGMTVLFQFAKAMPTLLATGKDRATENKGRARGASRRNPERSSRKRVRKMAN